MPGRVEMHDSDAVDIDKRYDIYVAETPSRIVVYRSALFRGMRFLERTRTIEYGAEFFEVEQAKGEVVYLRRPSVIKFCDAGGKLTSEVIC